MRGLISWSASDIEDHNTALNNRIVAALLQLMCNHGPTDDDIGFLSQDSLPIAKRDYRVNELKLFPHTRIISNSILDRGMFAQVDVTVYDSRPQRFYLMRAAQVLAKFKGKGISKISPFWNAAFYNEVEI